MYATSSRTPNGAKTEGYVARCHRSRRFPRSFPTDHRSLVEGTPSSPGWHNRSHVADGAKQYRHGLFSDLRGEQLRGTGHLDFRHNDTGYQAIVKPGCGRLNPFQPSLLDHVIPQHRYYSVTKTFSVCSRNSAISVLASINDFVVQVGCSLDF